MHGMNARNTNRYMNVTDLKKCQTASDFLSVVVLGMRFRCPNQFAQALQVFMNVSEGDPAVCACGGGASGIDMPHISATLASRNSSRGSRLALGMPRPVPRTFRCVRAYVDSSHLLESSRVQVSTAPLIWAIVASHFSAHGRNKPLDQALLAHAHARAHTRTHALSHTIEYVCRAFAFANHSQHVFTCKSSQVSSCPYPLG